MAPPSWSVDLNLRYISLITVTLLAHLGKHAAGIPDLLGAHSAAVGRTPHFMKARSPAPHPRPTLIAVPTDRIQICNICTDMVPTRNTLGESGEEVRPAGIRELAGHRLLRQVRPDALAAPPRMDGSGDSMEPKIFPRGSGPVLLEAQDL